MQDRIKEYLNKTRDMKKVREEFNETYMGDYPFDRSFSVRLKYNLDGLQLNFGENGHVELLSDNEILFLKSKIDQYIKRRGKE